MSENVGMNAPDQVGDVAEDTVFDVEKIQEEAKATFSLRGRLQGMKQKRQAVPLFLNLPAVGEYQAAKAEADAIFTQAERPGIKDEIRTALLDEHNKALDKANAAQEQMLADTIVVHLVTVPNKVVKATRAKIGLQAKAEAKGVPLSEERFGELSEFTARSIMALGIERIVQSDGAQQVGATVEDVLALEEELPTVQWDRLYQAFELLLLSKEAELAAVNEPGF